MKNKKIDVDLIDTEPDPVMLKKNVLSTEDSYLLSLTRNMVIKGTKYFLRKRFNTRIEAERNLGKNEIIVETRIAAFILSLNQPRAESFSISNYI